jgi:hypothetical protein
MNGKNNSNKIFLLRYMRSQFEKANQAMAIKFLKNKNRRSITI